MRFWFLAFFLLFLSSIVRAQDEIDTLLDEAWSNYEQEPEHSLKILDQALLLCRNSEDETRELEALEMKGIVYDELDFSNKAVEIYLEVLERRKKRQEEEYYVSLYLNLGIVYEKMEQFQEALKYFQLAKAISSDNSDQEGVILSSINLATTLSELDNTQECIYLLNELLENYQLDSITLVAVYTDRGLAYQREFKLEQAYADYRMALAYLGSLSKSREVIVLSNFGKLNRQMDSLPQSKEILNRCFQLSEEIRDLSSMAFSSSELSLVFEKMGNAPDSALFWLKTSKSISDSIASLRDERFINSLNTVYKVQEQEDKIARLEQDQLKKQNRLVIIIGLSITVVSSLVILLLVYRNRFLRKKKEQEIQSLIIAQKEKELTQYRTELQSRTKNLLEKNRLLRGIQSELEQTKSLKQENLQELQQKILTQEDWDQYRKAFKQVYPDFLKKLSARSKDLTQGEVRTAVLLKQELSNSEIADILGISERSVIQNKYRLRKKLQLTEVEELISYILSL